MIASLSSARRVSCVTMQRRLRGQWSVEAGENRPRMSKINLGLKRFIFKWAIPSLFFYIFRLFNADLTTVHKLFSGTKITDACLNRNSHLKILLNHIQWEALTDLLIQKSFHESSTCVVNVAASRMNLLYLLDFDEISVESFPSPTLRFGIWIFSWLQIDTFWSFWCVLETNLSTIISVVIFEPLIFVV